MERLGDYELVMIAQRVAWYGSHHLSSFLQTSRAHARICRLPEVLRALPLEHADWLGYYDLTSRQVSFLNAIIKKGHPDYCVLRGVSLLHKIDPNVEIVRHVLNIASASKAEVVDYFLMLLDATAEGTKGIDKAICVFTKFFRAQELSELHLRMCGWGTPY